MAALGRPSFRYGDESIKKQLPGLAKGQVWKTDSSYLQLVDQGRRQSITSS